VGKGGEEIPAHEPGGFRRALLRLRPLAREGEKKKKIAYGKGGGLLLLEPTSPQCGNDVIIQITMNSGDVGSAIFLNGKENEPSSPEGGDIEARQIQKRKNFPPF